MNKGKGGQGGQGRNHSFKLAPHGKSLQLNMKICLANTQCPMTPLALSRETRPTQWLPNAHFKLEGD